MREVAGFKVIDRQTKQILKTYNASQGKVARRFVDKKDSEYGAVRYVAEVIWADEVKS